MPVLEIVCAMIVHTSRSDMPWGDWASWNLTPLKFHTGNGVPRNNAFLFGRIKEKTGYDHIACFTSSNDALNGKFLMWELFQVVRNFDRSPDWSSSRSWSSSDQIRLLAVICTDLVISSSIWYIVNALWPNQCFPNHDDDSRPIAMNIFYLPPFPFGDTHQEIKKSMRCVNPEFTRR